MSCFGELAQGEEEVEDTPAETLYLGMLPNLSQFVVSGSGKTFLRFDVKGFFFLFLLTSRVSSVSDRPPEAAAGCGADLQGQDGLHQHPGRRAARGDAVRISMVVQRNAGSTTW